MSDYWHRWLDRNIPNYLYQSHLPEQCPACEIERLQALLQRAANTLKHAAGAYIDADRGEHHQPTLDLAWECEYAARGTDKNRRENEE